MIPYKEKLKIRYFKSLKISSIKLNNDYLYEQNFNLTDL